jgi:hypothetical protein
VKFPSLPLDFWSLEVFEENGYALGTFFEVDMNFLHMDITL